MSIKNKFHTYLSAFDGTKKIFSNMEHLFEEIYDRDFVLDVGSGHVEFKFCMVNVNMNVVIHNIATAEGKRLLVAQPIDQGSSKSVGKVLGAIELHEAGKIASSTNWTKS
ncbi:hypothetical protein HJC23_005459 [Cyclotella cryptica]|uniref:Uncharacterized protein n=1 Tax=Cyclotella cryptica TaxID=29204 RepID=A0ABD3PLD2_9STRA